MSESHGQRAGVQVQLSVRRGSDAISFYVEAFGATVAYRHGGGGEVVAQLAVGDTLFWVEDESPPHDHFSPETLGGATERLLLGVNDPDAVIAQALRAGAQVVHPVQPAHGGLLGRIVDPFGHHWEIGRPQATWPPPSSLANLQGGANLRGGAS